VITYNGEIYNYIELRSELTLGGCSFRTNSDTEVILAGFARHGSAYLRRLNGMFAFAIYDREKGEITLARDRFGIKPLYYAKKGRDLIFSSSSRSVANHPDVSRKLNRSAIQDYLQFRYISRHRTMFEEVACLTPGHFAVWTPQEFRIEKYAHHVGSNRRDMTDADWVNSIRERLKESVRTQLRSDTPTGILLSSGVDSSLILHLAMQERNHPIKAFTVSIGDRWDEVSAAKKLAHEYGIDHETVYLEPGLREERVHMAVSAMDQPVADAVILPTYALCAQASASCKVVLTGEGADELFGGYFYFGPLSRLGRLSHRMPWLKNAAPLVRRIPRGLLNRLFDYPAALGSEGREKVARMVGSMDRPNALFRVATSTLDDADIQRALRWNVNEAETDIRDLSFRSLVKQSLSQWLPNQILSKMDQLSMAHGLEARVPYLDNCVADLMFDARDEQLIARGINKPLLRAAAQAEGSLAAYTPKTPFNLPIEELYLQDLIALSRSWLSSSMLKKFGVLNPMFVEDCIKMVQGGDFLSAKRLFTFVSLHMWLDENRVVI
jgi:asparagine synthase (glutamine-hydrolysing)